MFKDFKDAYFSLKSKLSGVEDKQNGSYESFHENTECDHLIIIEKSLSPTKGLEDETKKVDLNLNQIEKPTNDENDELRQSIQNETPFDKVQMDRKSIVTTDDDPLKPTVYSTELQDCVVSYTACIRPSDIKSCNLNKITEKKKEEIIETSYQKYKQIMLNAEIMGAPNPVKSKASTPITKSGGSKGSSSSLKSEQKDKDHLDSFGMVKLEEMLGRLNISDSKGIKHIVNDIGYKNTVESRKNLNEEIRYLKNKSEVSWKSILDLIKIQKQKAKEAENSSSAIVFEKILSADAEKNVLKANNSLDREDNTQAITINSSSSELIVSPDHVIESSPKKSADITQSSKNPCNLKPPDNIEQRLKRHRLKAISRKRDGEIRGNDSIVQKAIQMRWASEKDYMESRSKQINPDIFLRKSSKSMSVCTDVLEATKTEGEMKIELKIELVESDKDNCLNMPLPKVAEDSDSSSISSVSRSSPSSIKNINKASTDYDSDDEGDDYKTLIGKYALQEMVDQVQSYNLTEEEKSVLWAYCMEEVYALFNQNSESAVSNQKELHDSPIVSTRSPKDVNKTHTTQSSTKKIPAATPVTDNENIHENSERDIRFFKKNGILRFLVPVEYLEESVINIVTNSPPGPVDQKETSTNEIPIQRDSNCHENVISNKKRNNDDRDASNKSLSQSEDEDENEDIISKGSTTTDAETEVDESKHYHNFLDFSDISEPRSFCSSNDSLFYTPECITPNQVNGTEDKDEINVQNEKKFTANIERTAYDEKKVIQNTSKNVGSCIKPDLKELLQSLKELDSPMLLSAQDEYLCQEIRSLSSNPNTISPIHHKDNDILQENAHDSLYQFDSNFHRYITNAYSFDINLLDNDISGIEEKANESLKSENDKEFVTPPDYPSKSKQYELTGDVLLLQEMMKRALESDEVPDEKSIPLGDKIGHPIDRSKEESHPSNDDMGKSHNYNLDKLNDTFDDIRRDLQLLREDQEFVIFQPHGELNFDFKSTKSEFSDIHIETKSVPNESNITNKENCENEHECKSMKSEFPDIPIETKSVRNENNITNKENCEKEHECISPDIRKKENEDWKERNANLSSCDLEPITTLILQNKYAARSKITSLGFTLRDCVDTYERVAWYPTKHFNMLACDAEIYINHMENMLPYISKVHHDEVHFGTKMFSLNKKSLKQIGSIEDLPNVLDCSLDIRRSLADEIFPLAYSNRKETQRMNNILKYAFRNLNGVTSPFSLSDKDIQDLASREIIQFPPREQKNTYGSSMYKENSGKIIVILNYQEHIRLICSSRPADPKRVFEDASSLLNNIEEKLSEANQRFAWHEQLGYLNPNPEHLGMSCILSIRASFENLPENTCLTQILSKYGMEITYSSYNQKLRKFVYYLRNKHQFGTSEIDMLKHMISGVRLLSQIDERLAKGIPVDDLLGTL